MLTLKLLALTDGLDIYEMLQQIAKDDNGFHNQACGMTYEQFICWLEKEYGYDHGALEDWMVSQSSYWLYDGDTPVGYGRLRHRLNDALRETSGHIGYAIARPHRGQGYVTRLLALLLKECRKLGIPQVQIGCNAQNKPSARVIERSGGRLVRESGGKLFYWVEVGETSGAVNYAVSCSIKTTSPNNRMNSLSD